MADTQDLKGCPFCGCAATYVKHSAGMPGTQGYDKWDAVACKHCRATVGACDRRISAQPAPAAREPLTFEEWWESAGPNTVSAYESARSTWEFLVAHGVNQPKEGSA